MNGIIDAVTIFREPPASEQFFHTSCDPKLLARIIALELSAAGELSGSLPDAESVILKALNNCLGRKE